MSLRRYLLMQPQILVNRIHYSNSRVSMAVQRNDLIIQTKKMHLITLTSHCLLLWWLQLERGVPYWCHERSEKNLEYLIGNNMRCYHWEKSSIFATTMYDVVNAFPSTWFKELLMGLENWLKLTTKMQDGLLCSVFEEKMNHLWPKHILKWENKHYLCWWCNFWD